MLTINIVCVGNLKEKFWKDAQEEYKKRLSRFCNLNIVELKEENQLGQVDKILEVEGEAILRAVKGKTYLLAIEGEQCSSEQFAKEIEKTSNQNSQLSFVIGSSHGVSKQVKQKLSSQISFGKLTFPHNLARVMLLEQIYRAFMINSGAKYHK